MENRWVRASIHGPIGISAPGQDAIRPCRFGPERSPQGLSSAFPFPSFSSPPLSSPLLFSPLRPSIHYPARDRRLLVLFTSTLRRISSVQHCYLSHFHFVCCTNLGSSSHSTTTTITITFFFTAYRLLFPVHLLVDIFTTTLPSIYPLPSFFYPQPQWKVPSSKSLSTPRAPTSLTLQPLVLPTIPWLASIISSILTQKHLACPPSIVRHHLLYF
jgi:hypothetical protein